MEQENQEQEIIKKPRGRPKLAEHLLKTEKKTYPKEYYTDYYQKTCKPFKCSCGKEVNFRNKAKHYKSKHHVEFTALLEELNNKN
jgi:hypothetical protein